MDLRHNGTSLTPLVFLTGGLIGAVLGLLFAPRSGTETRTKIKEQTQNTREKIREEAKTAMAKAEEWKNIVKERYSEAQGKIRDSVTRVKETLVPQKSEKNEEHSV